MKSNATVYVCSYCDAQTTKWQGRCFTCGKWGTLDEEANIANNTAKNLSATPAAKTVNFADIKIQSLNRLKTGIDELDRVLGGGLVPGSLVLLGGEPGIGKSTLILQVCNAVADSVLYVSGEESAEQIKSRMDRLSIKPQAIKFYGGTNIETILATLEKEKPKLAIIDSIQTMSSNEAPSAPGSVQQVRICTALLLQFSKNHKTALIVIGHVTKFGEVAGPKTLEHLVDSVLYLEGDRYNAWRILRGVKNRFGSIDEVGIFEMTGSGLREISNPTAIFLERNAHAPGNATTPAIEGSRIFFLEAQTLVNTTQYGHPQRKAYGYDANRLQLLIATLGQRLKLKLMDKDIYLNIAGGLKISEPGADLAICASLMSAYNDKAISQEMVIFGEVGLSGEVRPVTQAEKRLKEAKKLGFKQAVLPKTKTKVSIPGIATKTVSHLSELNALLNFK